MLKKTLPTIFFIVRVYNHFCSFSVDNHLNSWVLTNRKFCIVKWIYSELDELTNELELCKYNCTHLCTLQSLPLTIFLTDTPPLFGLDCAATAARPPRPPAMSSRIGLRLQLMRDQMQQEEQRERQQQQAVSMHYMQHRMPGPPAPTPAISAPTHFQGPMQVPVEVLKVGLSISLCVCEFDKLTAYFTWILHLWI